MRPCSTRRHWATPSSANGVTALWLTVGLFNQYAVQLEPAFARLRHLLVGGDVLDPAIIRNLIDGGHAPAAMVNGYGPTESTTFAATFAIASVPADAVSIPIGRPIANTSLYILDAHGEPVPIGVPGELFIGGDGVARGYLNRPELTAERFIDDPFSNKPDARMYKTGDLARWLPDGNVEYLGRNDFQVKVRGFRIELGEIEARLAAAEGVREAVVGVHEAGAGDKRLVAWFVAEEGAEPEAAALRHHLSATLPDYMLPAAFVRMDVFPLTPNGKLDRKALPAPDQDALVSREYEAPVGDIETTIAAIWQELLRVERVGRHDNFFELGGHSLLAVQWSSRAYHQRAGCRATAACAVRPAGR
jgi:acyl-CoA synthetase (AMP-forming)/AMP-acid ligase II